MLHGGVTVNSPAVLMQAITISSVILLTTSGRAQGPQFDVGAPPGAAGGASTVGQPLGAANFPDFDTPVDRTVQRPGRARRHPRPVAGLGSPACPSSGSNRAQAAVPAVQPLQTSPPTATSSCPTEAGRLRPPGRHDARCRHRAADQAEPRPRGRPPGDPHGPGRRPHGQPPRQPDLLRRHPAHSLRPLLVPAARRPAAERHQHQLSARHHRSSGRRAPTRRARPRSHRGPAPGRHPQLRSTTSTPSTWTSSPPA